MDWRDTAARLAQLGLPVLGKAVGTLVGGQIPIFGGMISGAGENIGKEAADMIATALGVEPTPDAISQVINTQTQTDVVARLSAAETEAQVKWPNLAAIAKAQFEENTKRFIAGVAGDESARSSQLELVKAGSPIQYTPIAVSLIVIVGYFAAVGVLLLRPFTVSSDFKDVLLFMLGALLGGFNQVISFWLGSSSGSQQKDTALRDIAATSVVQAGTTANVAAAKKR